MASRFDTLVKKRGAPLLMGALGERDEEGALATIECIPPGGGDPTGYKAIVGPLRAEEEEFEGATRSRSQRTDRVRITVQSRPEAPLLTGKWVISQFGDAPFAVDRVEEQSPTFFTLELTRPSDMGTKQGNRER